MVLSFKDSPRKPLGRRPRERERDRDAVGNWSRLVNKSWKEAEGRKEASVTSLFRISGQGVLHMRSVVPNEL